MKNKELRDGPMDSDKSASIESRQQFEELNSLSQWLHAQVLMFYAVDAILLTALLLDKDPVELRPDTATVAMIINNWLPDSPELDMVKARKDAVEPITVLLDQLSQWLPLLKKRVSFLNVDDDR